MKTPFALPPGFDLTQLARVPLDAHHARLLQLAKATCGGPPAWRSRKGMEGHDVLALAQVTRRITVLALDLREAMRIHFLMRAPVPCLPDPAGELQVGSCAELGLCYPESAVVEPQPGYNFIFLLHPIPAWHPNIAPPASDQRICLGPQLPAATRLREIIFLTYQALTLAAAQFNPLDPAGVMNGAAAEWYQRNPDRIPLTREPFIFFGENGPAAAKEK
jgi:hypothetical protein